jgi:hypothetical protein
MGGFMIHDLKNFKLISFLFALSCLNSAIFAAMDDSQQMRKFKQAIQENKYEVIRNMLESGFDHDSRDSSGVSVVRIAVHNCCFEIAELLIGYGANLRADDNVRLGILQQEAFFGKLGAVYYLLQHGFDLNEQNAVASRGTVLMDMAYSSPVDNPTDLSAYEKRVMFLLNHGARMDLVNSQGQTALDIAKSRSNQAMQRILRCYRATQDERKTLLAKIVMDAFDRYVIDNNPVLLAQYLGIDNAQRFPAKLAERVKKLFPLDRDRMDPVLDQHNNQVINSRGKPVVQFVHEGEPLILPELRRDFQDYQAKQIQRIGRGYRDRTALKKA